MAAPGLYAEIFGPSITPNYVIDGLQNFSLVGMGPHQTIIRGDHSFSLIRVDSPKVPTSVRLLFHTMEFIKFSVAHSFKIPPELKLAS